MAHTSVKISANSSDYQSQMKSAASQMKVLSSEFKLAQTPSKSVRFGSRPTQGESREPHSKNHSAKEYRSIKQ